MNQYDKLQFGHGPLRKKSFRRPRREYCMGVLQQQLQAFFKRENLVPANKLIWEGPSYLSVNVQMHIDSEIIASSKFCCLHSSKHLYCPANSSDKSNSSNSGSSRDAL